MISDLISWMEHLANQLPLQWYMFIGAFLEEIIVPIPSALIAPLAGSIAADRGASVLFMVWLVAMASLGKTVAGYVLYVLADRIEDVVVGKWGKYIGISHREIEKFGQYLSKGRRDDVVIFALRALPLVSSGAVSVVCGLVKIKLRTYLLSSFLGNMVRHGLYFYVGVAGLTIFETVSEEQMNVGAALSILGVVLLIGGLIWIFKKNRSKLTEKIAE